MVSTRYQSLLTFSSMLDHTEFPICALVLYLEWLMGYLVYRIGLLEGWVNATPVMRYVLKKRMQKTTEDASQMEVAYCKTSTESKTCAILIYIPLPIGETIRA